MHKEATKVIVDMLKETAIGKRIRLVSTTDPFTDLKPGDEGTVDIVDDAGTVFAKWDNGSSLGLVFQEDRWEYC